MVQGKQGSKEYDGRSKLPVHDPKEHTTRQRIEDRMSSPSLASRYILTTDPKIFSNKKTKCCVHAVKWPHIGCLRVVRYE